jgi:mannitol/fructose-specific phosphotransferase system IIA component (Ntr-type)
MVNHLSARGYIGDAKKIVRLLLDREKLMSTGIKRGFAIPHAFTAQLEKSIMMVGVSRRGVDFQALDDEPVFFVFLLLGPPDDQGLHMCLLARLSRLMNQDSFYGRLETAAVPREILDVIAAEEKKIPLSA